MNLSNKKWYVAQKDRREQYNIPRLISQSADLKAFYTNLWIPKQYLNLSSANVRLSRYLSKLKCYSNNEIANEIVKSRNIRTLLGRAFTRSTENKFDAWVTDGSNFSSWVAKSLKDLLDEESASFGYTCENLELMKLMKQKGGFAVHGQVDPGLEWYKVFEDEANLFPGASTSFESPSASFIDRISEEWLIADKIIVNSKYSKNSLIKHGVAPKKIQVIPLSFNGTITQREKIANLKHQPLNILFVGNLSLAKGIQYYGQVAEQLNGLGFNFFAAGNLALEDKFFRKMNWPIELLGHLSPDEMKDRYKETDILIFPTLSEGFGMVQLEAMSYGIPVITTPNCGEVVEHGESGYITDCRNSEQIVEHLLKLQTHRELLKQLSNGAHNRVRDFQGNDFKNIFFSNN